MNFLRKNRSLLLQTLVWLAIFLFPYLYTTLKNTVPDSYDIYYHVVDISGKIILFYLNYFLLASLLLHKKYFLYALLSLLIVFIVTTIVFNIDYYLPFEPTNIATTYESNEEIYGTISSIEIFMLYSSNILMVGFSTAFRLFDKMYTDEKKLREIEKLQISTELTMLKNQIHPHFFFNTLNNIHHLIEIDRLKAQESIVELSRLMRYLLYETSEPFVSLEKEITFLKNYISLMKMRLPEHTRLFSYFPSNVEKYKIPPLLLIMLVENTFKHCYLLHANAFMEFSIEVHNNRIIFLAKNNMKSNTQFDIDHLGVGLTNIRQRLDLLYGKNYKFNIKNENDIFETELILNYAGYDKK